MKNKPTASEIKIAIETIQSLAQIASIHGMLREVPELVKVIKFLCQVQGSTAREVLKKYGL
jgi:hypothetical protein